MTKKMINVKLMAKISQNILFLMLFKLTEI